MWYDKEAERERARAKRKWSWVDTLRLKVATWKYKRQKLKQYKLMLQWGKQHRVSYYRPKHNRWLGFRSLLPVIFISDEFDRHMIGFGWGVVGYILIAYKNCVNYEKINNCKWESRWYSYARWRIGGEFIRNEWREFYNARNYQDN